MSQQVRELSDGIVRDPELTLEARHELFEPAFWQHKAAATMQTAGRGNVVFIDEGERHWVLRHYRRGGLIGKLITDQYAWFGAEATRSFREWNLLAQLRAQGLPVPRPVAARYVRSGLLYRADLLTETIVDATTLAQRLAESALPLAAWQQIGATLARFHAAGVHHADLNAHNIIFDDAQRVLLLDFDRGRIRNINRQWIEQVLARLLRSLNKLQAQRGIHFSLDAWQQLVQAHDVQLTQLRSTSRA